MPGPNKQLLAHPWRHALRAWLALVSRAMLQRISQPCSHVPLGKLAYCSREHADAINRITT
eukprot:1458062-Pleurochrysis_carterae.AAC.1